jgi:hypothetical protein
MMMMEISRESITGGEWPGSLQASPLQKTLRSPHVGANKSLLGGMLILNNSAIAKFFAFDQRPKACLYVVFPDRFGESVAAAYEF